MQPHNGNGGQSNSPLAASCWWLYHSRDIILAALDTRQSRPHLKDTFSGMRQRQVGIGEWWKVETMQDHTSAGVGFHRSLIEGCGGIGHVTYCQLQVTYIASSTVHAFIH